VADGQVSRQGRAGAGRLAVDRDRLDPVNEVLQVQARARGLRHVDGRPRVGRLGADVEE
jgi:hypothetical protein